MISSLGRTVSVMVMFQRYFARRVLSIGVLRSKLARWLLGLGVVGFISGASVIAYRFMLPLGDSPGIWGYIYDLSSISVTITVLAIFMGLRLLFGGNSALFEFTFQLPLSHRERRASFLGFELVAVLGITSILLAAMAISSSLLLGWRAIWLATTPLATGMIVFLGVTVLHNLADALVVQIGLGRIRVPLLLLLIFSLTLWLNTQLPALITAISLPGASERVLMGLNLMPWLLHHYGPLVYLVAAILIAGIFIPLSLLTASSAHPVIQRFVNLALPVRISGPWRVHFAYALRNQQLWLGAVLAAVLFSYLAFTSGSPHPLWAGALLSLPGMYQYGNTRCLRVLHPEGSAWLIWGRILGTQWLIMVFVQLVGIAVLAAFEISLLGSAPLPIAGTLSGVIFAVLVGSAFPAEDDNPFSVLLGCFVFGVVFAFVGILTGLLQLTFVATIALLVLLHLAAVLVSVAAINYHERRNRYATGQMRAF